MFSWICKRILQTALAGFCIACTVTYPAKSQDILAFFSNSPNITMEHADFSGKHKEIIESFYADRQYEPFWYSPRGNLSNFAYDFMETIADSWSHGLNPASYGANELQRKQFDTPEDLAGHEILFTRAFMKYVHDLSGMRIPASDIGLREKDWLQPYPAEEILKFLKMGDMIRIENSILQKSVTYDLLREELRNLVEHATWEQTFSTIDFNGRLLRPGQSHPNVPLLRARLGLTDIYNNDANFYDPDLANAVRDFQRVRGLNIDGVIGDQTLQILNQTHDDKIRQIVANLERLRWAKPMGEGKYVVVNVPSAKLWAIDNNQLEFEMPVVVGRKKRETNIFSTDITGLRLNPDWTVPPTIKKEDFLTASRKDPEYLNKKGIKIYAGYGKDSERLDPAYIPWESMTENDVKSLRMVQPPSLNNPLGQYRVIMPNPYNIYLHDTNHKSLFDNNMRAESSGCIRMEKPELIASFIMENKNNWPPEKTKKILESGKKTDITIDNPIPVRIYYYTAWVGKNGEIVYGNDIYEKDRALIEQLKALDDTVI